MFAKKNLLFVLSILFVIVSCQKEYIEPIRLQEVSSFSQRSLHPNDCINDLFPELDSALNIAAVQLIYTAIIEVKGDSLLQYGEPAWAGTVGLDSIDALSGDVIHYAVIPHVIPGEGHVNSLFAMQYDQSLNFLYVVLPRDYIKNDTAISIMGDTFQMGQALELLEHLQYVLFCNVKSSQESQVRCVDPGCYDFKEKGWLGRFFSDVWGAITDFTGGISGGNPFDFGGITFDLNAGSGNPFTGNYGGGSTNSFLDVYLDRVDECLGMITPTDPDNTDPIDPVENPEDCIPLLRMYNCAGMSKLDVAWWMWYFHDTAGDGCNEEESVADFACSGDRQVASNRINSFRFLEARGLVNDWCQYEADVNAIDALKEAGIRIDDDLEECVVQQQGLAVQANNIIQALVSTENPAVVNQIVEEYVTDVLGSCPENLSVSETDLAKIQDYLKNHLDDENTDELHEFGTAVVSLLRFDNEINVDRVTELNDLLKTNPKLLIESCFTEQDQHDINFWSELGSFQPNQTILDILAAAEDGDEDDFEIQLLQDAGATRVNMDYFSINITQLPAGYNNIKDLFDHVRKDINIFVNPLMAIFTPITTDDMVLWASPDPWGALVSISIPLNDGTVVVSHTEYCCWIFSTVNAPWNGNSSNFADDNIHPVSGNRQFGFLTNTDGSYTIYTKGVDRMQSIFAPLVQFLAYAGSDALWSSFQTKTTEFINSNGGQSTVIPKETYRPKWNKVREALVSDQPLQVISCDN